MTSVFEPSIVRPSARRLEVAAVAILLLCAIGCGSPTVPATQDGHDHMKVLGKLYGRMTSQQRGAYPRNEAAFIAYLEREPANWNKLAPSAKLFLSSPRSGEPLRILYGAEVKDPVEGGFPWIAYESSPLDGKRLIVNAQGLVEFVDNQKFGQLVPNPSE